MAQAVSPIFKDHCVSTRHRIITSVITKNYYAHRNNDLIYCQIKNEGAFPADQPPLRVKRFRGVSIHLFYQINNNALQGASKADLNKEEKSLSG